MSLERINTRLIDIESELRIMRAQIVRYVEFVIHTKMLELGMMTPKEYAELL